VGYEKSGGARILWWLCNFVDTNATEKSASTAQDRLMNGKGIDVTVSSVGVWPMLARRSHCSLAT